MKKADADGNGNFNASERMNALRGLDWMSDAKRVVLFKQMYESREDVEEVLDQGISFDSFIDAYDKHEQINNNDNLKPGDKATEWARWLDENYDADKADILEEYLGYYAISRVEAANYGKMTGKGLDTETAYNISAVLSDLEPLKGKTSVSDSQKYMAIADMDIKDADKLKAYSAIMESTTYDKLIKAYKAGIALKDYTKYLSDTSRIVSDQKNGKTVSNSYRQKVLTYIYSMRNLTKFQKDALYYLAGYSSKTIGDSPWRNGRVYAGDIYKVKKNGKVYDK